MTRQHADVDDGAEQFSNGRYASLELESGSVLVYDVNDTDGWVQSDVAVSREAMR